MEKEKELSTSVSELQDSFSRLKQKREMKEKQLKDNDATLINLNRQLSRIASANIDFERIELDLKQAVRLENLYTPFLYPLSSFPLPSLSLFPLLSFSSLSLFLSFSSPSSHFHLFLYNLLLSSLSLSSLSDSRIKGVSRKR